MCSGSEAGSHLRLIDFVYHSTLGLIKNKIRFSTMPPADGGLVREVGSVVAWGQTSAGREVLLQRVVKLLRALRFRRQHRDVLDSGAAHSHVLGVRALVLAPRGVAAAVERRLVPVVPRRARI